jgi:hypothetical protein
MPFWLDAKALGREKAEDTNKEVKEVKQDGDENKEKGMKENVGKRRWKREGGRERMMMKRISRD